MWRILATIQSKYIKVHIYLLNNHPMFNSDKVQSGFLLIPSGGSWNTLHLTMTKVEQQVTDNTK